MKRHMYQPARMRLIISVDQKAEGLAMGVSGEISFKIAFLRTMAPLMTEPDLDTFTSVCQHFVDGTAVLADLNLLEQLYKKFDKPAGRENI
jgi:hypothetical protein